ncbi:amino acid permease 3 [Angomonas deanei]|uniref:Transmembrane amino acid transporter protein, putative n=1 Tax=Angomonas deanei TaxID=59799 RepID=A0A7G2C345_9TRYP|nr:amino acid permease 3 [Angomonas deanei]CAD2213935.1 Transmembrane amino acid transporter protein, putative [Angomonas deanei]|eukprot:EPY26401.1 amino acid permease 3 [Angomonas deanei]
MADAREPSYLTEDVSGGNEMQGEPYLEQKQYVHPDVVEEDVGGMSNGHHGGAPPFYSGIPVVNSVVRTVQRIVPPGGLVANCFQLGSVTLGGGIISMPDSFRTSGIIMAVIYLVVMCAVTVYSMLLLGYAMRLTGLDSYETMGRGLLGPGGDFFVGLVLCISCIGTAIGYITAAGTLMTPILELAPGTPDYLKSEMGIRLIQTLIWAVLLLPAIIPKKLNSIRYIAVLGVCFVLYFVVTIIVHSTMNGLHKGKRENMAYFTTGNTAIYALSIFIFAFMCQGIAYPVYYEMRPRPSVKQLTTASTIGMVACTILYILAGVFGYFDFADATEVSILENYDPIHTPYMMVSYVGMLIKIVAAFCANWVPIRNFFYYAFGWNLATTPYWLHTIFCVVVSGIILVAGLFIPKVSLAFGLVGSLTGGFVSFIFPAIFWMYCGNWSMKTVGFLHWLGCQFMLIAGVVAIVWGTIATVYYSFFV